MLFNRFRIAFFLFLCLIFLSAPYPCFAQRRSNDHEPRRDVPPAQPIRISTGKERTRIYDLSLECGLGNFAYDIFGESGAPGIQSVYHGDMLSVRSLLRVRDKKSAWGIDVSGEIFTSTNRLERWYSQHQLFRINKLEARGLAMDTMIRYAFEETALFPLPMLTQPRIGLGFAYRFLGMERTDAQTLIPISDEPPLADKTDFALFGIEPNLGFLFTLDNGKMNGHLDIRSGIYGASVEKNYKSTGSSTSLEKTLGRSIQARAGLSGVWRKISYQIGYDIFRLKIQAKGNIPESRTKLEQLVGRIGFRF